MTVEAPAPEGISEVAGGKAPPSPLRKALYGTTAVSGIIGVLLLLNLMSHHSAPPTAGISGNGLGTVGASFPVRAAPHPKPITWHLRPAAPIIHPPVVAQPRAQPAAPDPDLAAPISVASAGGGISPATVHAIKGRGSDSGGADDALSRALVGSNLGGPARASVLPHPAFTIPAGTQIPCTLTTAINSELPGFVNCVLPAPVQGATGAVTLLDKGTQVFGEVRSGLVMGENRLFILWLRARTPQNVTIPLLSPAADELGRSGVTGAVNNHWKQILAAAAAYTLIGSGPLLAAGALQGGNGNSFNLVGIGQPMQQAGTNAFQRQMDRPPTLEKAQGESVTIFIARDLYFNGVYGVRIAQ